MDTIPPMTEVHISLVCSQTPNADSSTDNMSGLDCGERPNGIHYVGFINVAL
jgi:hypothetical protein